MEKYTDYSDIQRPYLKLTDLDTNAYIPHIDFPSLPNPDTLQDLNSFPTNTHRTDFISTCEIFSDPRTADNLWMLMYVVLGGVSFPDQPVGQQDVIYST